MSHIIRLATDVDEALIESWHLNEQGYVNNVIIVLIDSEGVPYEAKSTLEPEDTIAVLNSLL